MHRYGPQIGSTKNANGVLVFKAQQHQATVAASDDLSGVCWYGMAPSRNGVCHCPSISHRRLLYSHNWFRGWPAGLHLDFDQCSARQKTRSTSDRRF